MSRATGLSLSLIWEALATCRKAGQDARYLIGHPDDGALGRLAAQEFILTWVPRSEMAPGQMKLQVERNAAA